MRAHTSPEEIALPTLDSLSPRRPIRDLSLADFSWVAQKSIYANPVVVTQSEFGVQELALSRAMRYSQHGVEDAGRDRDLSRRSLRASNADEIHERWAQISVRTV